MDFYAAIGAQGHVMAAQRDLPLSRSSTTPVAWRLLNKDRTPFDVAGSVLTLTMAWGGNRRMKVAGSPGSPGWSIDEAAARAQWTPTPAELAELPIGRIARYVLSRAVPGGEDRPLVEGFICLSR